MNEEEKEAIEIVKQIGINTYAEGRAKAIFLILNLIEKQQKEIENKNKILTDLEYFLKGISKHMKEEDFISSSIEYQNVLVKLYELKEKY